MSKSARAGDARSHCAGADGRASCAASTRLRFSDAVQRGLVNSEREPVADAAISAEPTRRDFLYLATTAAVAVGGAAMVWPFVGALAPDAETVAAGAPVELDLAPIAEGQIVKIFWRGKLIFVRHRTPAEIKAAQDVNLATLRDPQARRGPRQGRSCPVARGLRQLHPSRLRAARQRRRVPRLVLPLPRLGVRHLGPHPAGPRPDQPADPALHLRLRHRRSRSARAARPRPDRADELHSKAPQMSDHQHATTYVPKSAFAKWFESRLPIAGLIHSSFVAFPVPRNLNYFWTFGAVLFFMLVLQIVTGVILAMHYQPSATAAFDSRRAHHARRELRLAPALPARQRRLDVLRRRLHPHLPQPLLRLLQGAARDPLHPRRHHLLPDDGDRLPRLHAALGPDELLGRDRHHQHPGRDPGRRRHHPEPALGRLLGRQPDAEPLLLAALPPAVHDRRRRHPARLGAARAGQQQPGRHRDQVGHATRCRSTPT